MLICQFRREDKTQFANFDFFNFFDFAFLLKVGPTTVTRQRP